VSSALPAPSLPCTHDLGVGTTVCLRCRQEARQVARARQQWLLAKLGLTASALVGTYIVGASTINAWRAAARVSGIHEMPAMVTTAITTSEIKPQGEPRAVLSAPAVPAATVVPATVVPATVVPATVVPAAAIKAIEPTSAPLTLVVPEGRTELKDNVVAERAGDSVIVSFDLMMTRTRRRDKFERVLRETLPAVYGAPVDSILAAIPVGSLIGGGDLLTELPLRGIRVPLRTGYQLGVWPETRPGRDGLLVVRYRARMVKE
jgi:hypothetical protein